MDWDWGKMGMKKGGFGDIFCTGSFSKVLGGMMMCNTRNLGEKMDL